MLGCVCVCRPVFLVVVVVVLLLFLRQCFSLAPNSPNRLVWLPNESKGCACLHLHRGTCHMTSLGSVGSGD